MKKVLALAAMLIMAISLTGCSMTGSGGGKMADGVYTAQVDDVYVQNSGYGWRDTLSLTIKDGAVVSAEFDSFNANGDAKSKDSTYDMTPHPSEWMPQLSSNIAKATSAETIDGVAGATNSSTVARNLYAAIMKNGKVGETITVSMG